MDLVFQMLLQNHYNIDEGGSNKVTDNESSALWYIAGYDCRHLHKK